MNNTDNSNKMKPNRADAKNLKPRSTGQNRQNRPPKQARRPEQMQQPKQMKRPVKPQAQIFTDFHKPLPFVKKLDARKVLSLDIDVDKVRYVVAKKSGNYLQTLRWGVQKFPSEESNRLKALQIALENIHAKIYKPGMQVYASIFSPDINIRQVLMPKMRRKSELKNALYYKNQNDLQNFDEDSIWTYEIVEEFEEEGTTRQRILISVAPAKTVRKYLDIFENANMVLSNLVPRQAAILAAYSKMCAGDKSDMVVDISYDYSQICFIKNGRFEYFRNVGIGARNLEVIIRSDDKKATEGNEKKYPDKKRADEGNADAIRSRLLSKIKDLQEKQNPVLHTFFSEILRSIAFIQGRKKNNYIDRLVISGYGIRKESLVPYLKNRLKMPIIIMAPQLSESAAQPLQYGEFFTAIGTILQSRKTFSLLPEQYHNRVTFRKINWFLTFLIILGAGGLSFYSHLQNTILQNQRQLVAQYQKEYDKLNPVEGMYKDLVDQIAEVNAENQALLGFVEQQPPMLEVMKIFSNETPPEIIFENYHFYPVDEKAKGMKNAENKGERYRIDIEGIIKSELLVGDVILIDYINHLNDLNYFKNIQLNYKQKDPEKNITMFGVRLTL